MKDNKNIKDLRVQLHEQLYNELKNTTNYINPNMLFGSSELYILFALKDTSKQKCDFDVQVYNMYYDNHNKVYGNITLTCNIPIIDKNLVSDFQTELYKMVYHNDDIDNVEITTKYDEFVEGMKIKFRYKCTELNNFKIIPYVKKFMNVYKTKVLNKGRVDNPNHWKILNDNGFVDVLVKHSPLAKYKLCDYSPWGDEITRETPIFINLEYIDDGAGDKYIHIGSTCGVFNGPVLDFEGRHHWLEAQQVYMWNESYWENPPSGYDGKCILIQANHKGLLWSGLILFPLNPLPIDKSDEL
jgi:hypothetical protein